MGEQLEISGRLSHKGGKRRRPRSCAGGQDQPAQPQRRYPARGKPEGFTRDVPEVGEPGRGSEQSSPALGMLLA